MLNNIPWTSLPFLIGYAVAGLLLIGLIIVLVMRSRESAEQKTDESDETTKEIHVSKFFTDYYVGAFFFMIAGFVGAALLVIRPIIIEMKELGVQIGTEQQTLEENKKVLGVLGQSVAAAQNIPSVTLDSIAIALPNEPEYPRMLVDFATAAERNGVRINSVSFSEPKLNQPTKDKLDPTKGSVVPLALSLSLKAGTYTGVKRMLADVESNLRLMDITGISLNASTEGGFDYTVQIRSYMFLPPGVSMPK